jgi:hypothetical protein
MTWNKRWRRIRHQAFYWLSRGIWFEAYWGWKRFIGLGPAHRCRRCHCWVSRWYMHRCTGKETCQYWRLCPGCIRIVDRIDFERRLAAGEINISIFPEDSLFWNLAESFVTPECKNHPGQIVQDGLGDFLCLRCGGLKATDRCPCCHHNGKKDQIRWLNEGPDEDGIWGSIDCRACGKERASTDGVWHEGRYRWLVDAHEPLSDRFRWHAKQVASTIDHSDFLPDPLRRGIAHRIYETFLTERRPGHATIIGRVNRPKPGD